MRRAGLFALAAALVLMAAAHAAADPIELTAPGPLGRLHGTYLPAGKGAPVVLIVPGSGPTDRDGNSPLGVRAATYRLIAEGLARRGIASVRIDKRGMFASAKAVKDANAVTIAAYAADVRSWIGAIRKTTGARCVWLLGHSEGGLVSLAAAQKRDGICGVLLVAAPGRRLGDVLRTQLKGNPANAPYLPQMLEAIKTLEAGKSVDVNRLAPAVAPLFAPRIQGFMRDLFRHDPARLMADMTLPVLILQGDNDLQITLEDAQFLVAARPDAKLVLLPDANHVLKSAPKHSVMENLATYANSDLPLAPGVIDALANFILK